MSARVAIAWAGLVLAVVLLVGAVAAWRHGVRTSEFPTAAGPTPAAGTYYSGPWLAAAFLAVLVAGLLLIRGVTVLVRRPR